MTFENVIKVLRERMEQGKVAWVTHPKLPATLYVGNTGKISIQLNRMLPIASVDDLRVTDFLDDNWIVT